jgi:hypothetical protein
MSIATQRQTIVLGGLAAVVLVIMVIVLTGGGGGGSVVPITPALLQKAAQQADRTPGGGYDDTCALYGAPRQIVCQGAAGGSAAFLVSADGRLQLVPGSTVSEN